MSPERKGVISAKDWESGSSSANNTEKVAKVLSFLETLEKGEAAKMTAIREGTGLKWPYGTVVALVEAGSVESKKLGKAKYYRVK